LLTTRLTRLPRLFADALDTMVNFVKRTPIWVLQHGTTHMVAIHLQKLSVNLVLQLWLAVGFKVMLLGHV
jgi:hypothetical protein